VPRVEYEKLSDERLGEPSAAIQARVEAARERQRQRFGAGSGLLSNADMGLAEVRDHCPVDDAGRSLLRAAMQQRPGGTRVSARGYNELSWSSPHLQASADDCGPFEASGQAWRAATRSRRRILHFVQDRPGGGHPVPAEKTDVMASGTSGAADPVSATGMARDPVSAAAAKPIAF
jgi:hypothetical protein